MKAYGTEVYNTCCGWFGAAVAKAEELAAQPGISNVNSTTKLNPAIHYQTTGQEIIKSSTENSRCLHQYRYWWYDHRLAVLKEVNKDVEISGLNSWRSTIFISKGRKEDTKNLRNFRWFFEPARLLDREVIDGLNLFRDDAIETAKT